MKIADNICDPELAMLDIEEGMGYCYIVQLGVNGPVKVGFTTNVHRRLHALQNAVPQELILRALLPDDHRMLERGLHEDMAEFRLRGEWFVPVDALWFALRCTPQVDLSKLRAPRKSLKVGSRMPAADAELHWRDESLSMQQALAHMTGWSSSAARAAFGARFPHRRRWRNLSPQQAREMGKAGRDAAIERSAASLIKRPDIAALVPTLRAVWRSAEYAHRDDAARAVNDILRERDLPPLGGWQTIYRLWGGRGRRK